MREGGQKEGLRVVGGEDLAGVLRRVSLELRIGVDRLKWPRDNGEAREPFSRSEFLRMPRAIPGNCHVFVIWCSILACSSVGRPGKEPRYVQVGLVSIF